MPSEWDSEDSGGSDAIDYEELRRRLMGGSEGVAPDGGYRTQPPEGTLPVNPYALAGGRQSMQAVPNAPASDLNQSRPLTAVPNAPMPSGPRVMTPVSQPAPATMASTEPQPPSVGSIISGAGGPKLPPGIVKSNPLPSEIPPPTTDNNKALVDAINRRSQTGQPINPQEVDPATGKPKYRMGLGMRILGSLANAANGFARNGVAPEYVGPGATNRRFDVDTERQKQNLSNLDTEIGNREKLSGESQALYNSAIKSAYETQVGDYREKLGNAAEQRAAIAGQLESSQQERNAAIAERDRALGRKADEPKQPTNEVELVQAFNAEADPKKKAALGAAIEQLKSLKAAGKDTSAADLAKIIQINSQKQNMIHKVSKEKETERQRRYTELDKSLDKAFIVGPARVQKSQEGQQKIDADLETKYAQRMQDTSDEADKLLNLTKKGSTLQSKPNAAKPASAAPSGNIPPKPTVPPKLGKTWVYNKSTGVRGLVKNEDLKKATQGKDAQYATW